jgi:hypothetical protein
MLNPKKIFSVTKESKNSLATKNFKKGLLPLLSDNLVSDENS